MKTQFFFNNLLFTTQLFKMEQIYTLFCSCTLFILDSWIFKLINSSPIKIFKNIHEFSRTPENIQGQHDVFQESRTKRDLIANSRTVLGPQGRLATLSRVLLSSARPFRKRTSPMPFSKNKLMYHLPTVWTSFAKCQKQVFWHVTTSTPEKPVERIFLLQMQGWWLHLLSILRKCPISYVPQARTLRT